MFAPLAARARAAASSPLIFPRTDESDTQRLSNSTADASASSARRLDDTSGASSSAGASGDAASYVIRAKPAVRAAEDGHAVWVLRGGRLVVGGVGCCGREVEHAADRSRDAAQTSSTRVDADRARTPTRGVDIFSAPARR